MLLEILDIYRNGYHYIVQTRTERGDVALDDLTIRVTENDSEVAAVVIEYFEQNPDDHLVSVIVVKGKRLYVVKARVMRGLFLNRKSKILDAVQLSAEISEHLDFHTVRTLEELAA